MVKGSIRINWSDSIRYQAAFLRKSGSSLGDIHKQLHVPKTTLHEWLKSTPHPLHLSQISPSDWTRTIQPMAVEKLKSLKKARLEKIRLSEIESASKFIFNPVNAKALLSLLYWAEGYKTGHSIEFINTDPKMSQLFIKLLRTCYSIDETRLRIQLHLHYYHRVKATKKYWSDLLNIPLSQFNKTVHKPRSKEKHFRRNIGGICAIRYSDYSLKESLVQHAFALGDKILGNVPVAQRIERGPAEAEM